MARLRGLLARSRARIVHWLLGDVAFQLDEARAASSRAHAYRSEARAMLLKSEACTRVLIAWSAVPPNELVRLEFLDELMSDQVQRVTLLGKLEENGHGSNGS